MAASVFIKQRRNAPNETQDALGQSCYDIICISERGKCNALEGFTCWNNIYLPSIIQSFYAIICCILFSKWPFPTLFKFTADY